MTRLTTWLADLITGGELSRSRRAEFDANAQMIKGYYGLREASSHNAKKAEDYLAWGNERHAAWLKADTALRDIAAMETPSANATVRRMARTAREALE